MKCVHIFYMIIFKTKLTSRCAANSKLNVFLTNALLRDSHKFK